MIVPKGILFWIFISNIIVSFDAFYVINRPETMIGGKYYWLFKPYQYYYKFDKLYALNNDRFVVIQSWLNICEFLLAMIGVLFCLFKCKTMKTIGSIICLLVSVMVFWKTVLFVWYDHAFLSQDALKYTLQSILCYYIPSSLWLIFPLLSIILISYKLVKSINCSLQTTQSIKEKKKKV